MNHKLKFPINAYNAPNFVDLQSKETICSKSSTFHNLCEKRGETGVPDVSLSKTEKSLSKLTDSCNVCNDW